VPGSVGTGDNGGGILGGLGDILRGETTQIAQAHPEHRGILDSILDMVRGVRS